MRFERCRYLLRLLLCVVFIHGSDARINKQVGFVKQVRKNFIGTSFSVKFRVRQSHLGNCKRTKEASELLCQKMCTAVSYSKFLTDKCVDVIRARDREGDFDVKSRNNWKSIH